MNFFIERDGVLHAEDVSLEAIAREHGTPCYVYSRAAIEAAYGEFAGACAGRDALICFAVKSNANLGVLDVLRRLGAGFDIVSGGELYRAKKAGAKGSQIVFSGVGPGATAGTTTAKGKPLSPSSVKLQLERLGLR